MRYSLVSARRVNYARTAAAFCIALVVAACSSSSTETDRMPTQAAIAVSGSTTVPLRLIISTDFTETLNQATGQRAQVIHAADTINVSTLPWSRDVTLNETASILVDLSNPADESANVRLQVNLDSGQPPYDQSATMSRGGSLRYVFNFFTFVG